MASTDDTPAHAFRALHHGRGDGGPLVLPNVWDAVSAAAFAEAGFAALATSSSAVAATLGYADGGHTPPDEMFAAVGRVARAVPVPVTADVEDGYGLEPEELVDRLLEAGAVGCNLEDTDQRGGQLRDAGEHAGLLARFCAAADGRLVLNARVDTFLGGDHALQTAVDRARRYVDAGADCVFPILMEPRLLPEFSSAAGAPVNALCLPDGPPPVELGRLGAARVTFGGGLHDRATESVRGMAERLHAAEGTSVV